MPLVIFAVGGVDVVGDVVVIVVGVIVVVVGVVDGVVAVSAAVVVVDNGVVAVVDAVVVGGGMHSGELAKQSVEAGADWIVTGNLTEEYDDAGELEKVMRDYIQTMRS